MVYAARLFEPQKPAAGDLSEQITIRTSPKGECTDYCTMRCNAVCLTATVR